MPLIVFFIIGVIVAANEWHESFFWCIVALAVIYFVLGIWLDIRKQMRLIRQDKERAKRNGVKYRPEPVKLPSGYYWFTIIVVIVIVVLALLF